MKVYEYFSKICRENSSCIKIGKEWRVPLREDHHTFFIISRSFLLRMRNVSGKSCRENQNTHFVFSNFFSRKSCRLWEKGVNYCRTGQVTWQYGSCALGAGYLRLQTLRLCNTHCFSTARTVLRTRLTITLNYIACLTFFFMFCWPCITVYLS